MRYTIKALTMAFVLVFGLGTVAPALADQAGQSGQEKGKKSHQDKKKRKHRDQEPKAGGPMGETETGGAGPSGPSSLPPGKAPGFEGAAKEKGRGPTEGGTQ
jgi:hypothetical protein